MEKCLPPTPRFCRIESFIECEEEKRFWREYLWTQKNPGAATTAWHTAERKKKANVIEGIL